MQCAVMEKKNSKQPQLNFIIGCYKNQVQKLCLTLCIMLDKTAACFCELLLMASWKHLALIASRMSDNAAAEKDGDRQRLY